jgi:hypothetical protein
VSADETEPTREATQAPPHRGKLRPVLVLAGVFLLGGLSGLAVGRATANRELAHTLRRPPDELRAQMRLEGMRRHLDLRDEQVSALEALLRDAEAERARLVEPCQPELESLRERTDASLRALLDDEQRRRFDEHLSRRPRGPHPPGLHPPGPHPPGSWPPGRPPPPPP